MDPEYEYDRMILEDRIMMEQDGVYREDGDIRSSGLNDGVYREDVNIQSSDQPLKERSKICLIFLACRV